MIRNYFKTALRNLQRNKVYSFTNIIGLSLGLASAMLIILYVKDEVSYDRFHKNVNQIYRVCMISMKADGSVDSKNGNTGYFQGPRFTAGIPEIKAFLRYQSNQRDIQTGTEVRSQEVFYVDSSFFLFFHSPCCQATQVPLCWIRIQWSYQQIWQNSSSAIQMRWVKQ